MKRGPSKTRHDEAEALLDDLDDDEFTEVTPREKLPDYRDYRRSADSAPLPRRFEVSRSCDDR